MPNIKIIKLLSKGMIVLLKNKLIKGTETNVIM